MRCLGGPVLLLAVAAARFCGPAFSHFMVVLRDLLHNATMGQELAEWLSTNVVVLCRFFNIDSADEPTSSSLDGASQNGSAVR